jgi:hypothetical protein
MAFLEPTKMEVYTKYIFAAQSCAVPYVHSCFRFILRAEKQQVDPVLS